MPKQPTRPTLNVLERALAEFSPKWAAKRLAQKHMLALAGGYTGASRNRATLRNWSPDPVSADDDAAWDLPILRARSRDLVRNAPLAGGAIETAVVNVVGTGLSLQPAIDAEYLGLEDEAASAWQSNTEREFRLWCESTDCDITRAQTFYGLQSLAFRTTLESGDTFALLASVQRDTSPYSLAVQLIEADRVCNKDRGGNSETLVDGVELNAAGEAVAYHVANRHPVAYKSTKGMTWRVIPARGGSGRRNVIHLFDRQRPGQTRGVPMLAPVMEQFKQLGRYTDAELASAVNASIFSIFIKMDPDAFDALFDDSNAQNSYLAAAKQWDGSLNSSIDNPAKAVNLLPGESIEAPEPGRPSSQFDPFVNSVISQIGARLGIPQEVLTKHFNSSYSAARAALLDAWRFWRTRRDWLATHFCQPIYHAWLEEAVALGRISAPGYFADPAIRRAWSGAQWIGDGPGSIDPSKEVDAAEKRINLGISTRAAESILHDGTDWETKNRQLAKEQRARKDAGLQQEPPPAMPPAAAPAEPDEDDTAPPDGDKPNRMEEAMLALLGRESVINVTTAPVNVSTPPVNVSVGGGKQYALRTKNTIIRDEATGLIKHYVRESLDAQDNIVERTVRTPVRDPDTGLIVDILEEDPSHED